MDEMTAFERQVADEFVRRAGPVRPVNAAAILTAITATQSPKWRFQSMFGANKLVAGVLVVMVAATLALVRPFDGDQDILPGAERQVPWPTVVEGVIGFGAEASEPTVERVDDSDLLRFRGFRAVGPTREMSDTRLEGIVTLDSSWDTYRGNSDNPSVAVFTGMIRIENEEGAWQGGPITGVTLPDGTSTTATIVLRGEGAYEDLTAVLEVVQGQGSWTVSGAILGGDLPTIAESPQTRQTLLMPF